MKSLHHRGTDADPQEYTQVSLLDDAFWEQLYQRFCWLPDETPAVFRRAQERVFEIVG
jgi:hypothetical protein